MVGKIIGLVSCLMCAIAFLISGIGFMVSLYLGVAMICFDCTLGIYIVYRNYKRILGKYS